MKLKLLTSVPSFIFYIILLLFVTSMGAFIQVPKTYAQFCGQFPGYQQQNCDTPPGCPPGWTQIPGSGIAACPYAPAVYCCGYNTPNCNTNEQCFGGPPYNTCYNGNTVQQCYYESYTGGGTCNPVYTRNRTLTVPNCAGPGVCRNGVCIPWCSTGNKYTACNADGRVGANTTCNTNNADENCTYTTAPGFGTNCVQDACPNRACTFNSCNLPQFECLNGGPPCTQYFSISGNITDPGNSTPNVTVNCAGHGATGGAFTIGYGAKIKKGTYNCALALPAYYIAINPASGARPAFNVGPDRAGENFTVARVYQITGVIQDKTSPSTPNIPVTCTSSGGGGGTASGGNFTVPYGAHIRAGRVTCTLNLPANYIATNPASGQIALTAGGNNDPAAITFNVARVYQITGVIQDKTSPSTPNIPVTCTSSGGGAGTATGGNFTVPYADHLRAGRITCTLALPAYYIATNPASGQIAVTATGNNDPPPITFNVARVYQITGTIIDVDNNGTPAIPVTCTSSGGGAGTATGGNFTIPYADHLLAGRITCTLALPANYIAINPIPPTIAMTATGNNDPAAITFRVAEVFSVTGTITDVDGNGTPAIPVTCTDTNVGVGGGAGGATLNGGAFTFTYADQFRRGAVTCTLALPANYIAIAPNPPTIGFNVGPNRANVNFGVAEVFSIAGKVYDSLNGNAGVPNITVQTTGCVTQTDGNGNYLLPYGCHLRSRFSPYTVSITVPATYTNTGVTTQNVTVGPNQVGIDFAITKLFTVSGDVFLDYSIDGLQDNNPYTGGLEPNYAVRPVLQAQETLPPLSTDALNITTNVDGTYIIANLITGNVIISYLSLPADYYMTNPRNGPPATYQVAPGFACNTNGALGANCVAAPGPGGGQDIANLNFGIIDVYPWVQTVCSDIRENNGFTNREYYNDSAIINNASCSNPGVVYTGNGNANFGRGNASSTGQVVGGFQYPEVYNDIGSQELLSYTNLSAKQQTAGVAETNLSNVNGCNTLSNCTPANLTHGIYYTTAANGDVTLNGFTFPAGNYVFLIDGNLTITGNIIVPAGSTAVFAVSGNITIRPGVGSAANSTNPNLEGVYSTEKSFIVQNTGAYCTDLRLNVQGSIIVNAGNNGGTFQNNRNLCLNDAWYPTIQVTQRPDFLLNMPEFIRDEKIISHELTP